MKMALLISFFSISALVGRGITYEFSGGRFGDCLLCYLHAKWLSYTCDMPLFYKPFEYSSALWLDEKELHFQPSYAEFRLSRRFPVPDRRNIIFVCPYFPEVPPPPQTAPPNRHPYRFETNWKDPEFRKIAREMIAPKQPLVLITPPLHTVNIAIHIREGGEFDDEHTRLFDPLKLPPLAFYTQALLQVVELFPDLPLYCHIFTDALDPASFAAELERVVPSALPIQFECRRAYNHHTANVLEDFFSLFLFDVLIRPQSNYSIVPSLIHDFAIVYSPTGFLRKGRTITITETRLEKNEELYQQILDRKL